MTAHFLIDENQLKKIRTEISMGISLTTIAHTYNCKVSQLKYALMSESEKESYREKYRKAQQKERDDKNKREAYNKRRRERYHNDPAYANKCKQQSLDYYNFYIKNYK